MFPSNQYNRPLSKEQKSSYLDHQKPQYKQLMLGPLPSLSPVEIHQWTTPACLCVKISLLMVLREF